MIKSEKYQQDKGMITQLVVYYILLISKRLIAANLSKQKTLDADSRATQQIIFTDNANVSAIIYYIIEQSKEISLQCSKATTKVL